MAARGKPVYRWHDIGIVRATTYPVGLAVPDDVKLTGAGSCGRGLAWLKQAWQDDAVRRTVGAASADLHNRIERLLAAPESADLPDVRRVVVALASYLMRWKGRATPFGGFAGVAPLRISTGAPGALGAKVRWGDQHVAVTSVDAAWLGDVIARLHQSPALLERIPVVTNQCLHHRGDRIVVPGPPGDGPAQELAPIEISVRRTRPVEAAVSGARTPVAYGLLRDELAAKFPTVATAQLDTVLRGLVEHNVLLTSLTPPAIETDPLGYLCLELRGVLAHEVPDVRADVEDLYRLYDRIALTFPPEPAGIGDRRLTVDTALDCDVHIPARVAEAARDAAVALLRLSAFPHGYPQWRDYHARFRARYGPGAVVPVGELVADSGLGLPADYLGAGRGRAPRPFAVRDEQLVALVQKALLDDTDEIVLTDAMIDALAGESAADMQMPQRAEICVTVLAESTDAVDRGDFRLIVNGTPRPGSSMAGRLSHLLPVSDRARLATTYASGSGTAAQLVFPPRKRRNGNVTRTPRLLTHAIFLGDFERPGPHQISLADLAVTADAHRFRLLRLSTGEMIKPRVLHALEAGVHTPPLARFLAELCTARCAVYRGFDFGAAGNLPMLPRVRYRNTILASKRWRAAADDIAPRGSVAAAPDADDAAWTAALDAWRACLRVPDRVALVDVDRRLPLDLTRSLDRLILREKLARGPVDLHETHADDAIGWIGRAHEFLIPLTLTPSPQQAPAPRWPARPVVTASDGHLPGDRSLLCARLYGHPHRQNEILTTHLLRLGNDYLADVPGPGLLWWFQRHREMAHPDREPYLALYLHLTDTAGYGFVAERLGAWAADLRHARLLASLTLDTHEPQTARYGHGPALAAAYNLFAADSAAALAQIRAAAAGHHPAQALAAASMVDLAEAVTSSPTTACTWLTSELPQQTGRLDPALRDAVFTLISGTVDGPIAIAWRYRTIAAAAYRNALAAQGHDPRTVLRSLLHHHHVRALGVDPDQERVTERLARASALRFLASPLPHP